MNRKTHEHMKAKKIIETALLAIGLVCFIFICSEPAEGTSTKTWILGELAWLSALTCDMVLIRIIDNQSSRQP